MRARALDKGNICSNSEYLFSFLLISLSSQTRAFVRFLAEELGRWRCIGSGRRGGERVEVVSLSLVFLFKKKACVYTDTSIVTAVAAFVRERKEE